MTTESITRPECEIPERRASTSPREVRRLSRELVGVLTSSVPPFTELSAEVIAGDVTSAVRVCLGWAVRRLDGDTLPERVDPLYVAAAGWARAGIPIETVLHALHEGFKAGLHLLFARANPAGRDEIVTGAATTLELLDLITAAISKAYVHEDKALAAEHHTAVHVLTSALLRGRATAKVARQCGIRIADEYYVLALALPPHTDERRAGRDPHFVAVRKLRRVQAALATELRGNALSLLSVDGGTVLVPVALCTEPEIDEIVARLAEAGEVPITATVLRARTDEVSVAAGHAHEFLDTVKRVSRGPGVHRFAEVALQHQLTRPGIGRDILDARLRPLEAHPELMHTLRVFIGTDFNRQRTARRLHIHPNTVDYRMRRIGQLTGIDLSQASGLWYARSALIVSSSCRPGC
ncbi:helix-turn-helix domain-containing protein [Nocardia sp. NPDC019395]|uniref:PucR family transcriptional regulator n=1 Tax=Nocardia sp. NPDC019395 TaxID=3154686 RepID=UPI0033EAB30C